MDSSGVWVGSNFLVIRSYLNHRLRRSKEMPHVLFTYIELIIYIYCRYRILYVYILYTISHYIWYRMFALLHTNNIYIYIHCLPRNTTNTPQLLSCQGACAIFLSSVETAAKTFGLEVRRNAGWVGIHSGGIFPWGFLWDLI